MIYEIKQTKKFRDDVKRMIKRGKDLELLLSVVEKLKQDYELPPQNKDHNLIGNYAGFRECHISPDWLLVYRKNATTLFLTLLRTGTHSDLFKS